MHPMAGMEQPWALQGMAPRGQREAAHRGSASSQGCLPCQIENAAHLPATKAKAQSHRRSACSVTTSTSSGHAKCPCLTAIIQHQTSLGLWEAMVRAETSALHLGVLTGLHLEGFS